jgi:predicted transposase/invertase (TIGR01784 family)
MEKYNISKENKILLEKKLRINLDSDLFPVTSVYAFGRMLASKSDKSNIALKSLLNAVFKEEDNSSVKEIQIENPITYDNCIDRNYPIDACVLFEDGQQAFVELQLENTNNSVIRMRSQFSFAHFATRHRFSKPCYMISIFNYKNFNDHNDYFSEYKLRNYFANNLNGGTTMLFIELPKLPNKSIVKLSEIELWGWLFLYANDENKKQELEQVCNQVEGIKMAHEILAEISKNPKEREQFEAEMKAIADQLSIAQ